MDNVIQLAERVQKLDPDVDPHETFLLNEGLELLAAYRAIENVGVRLSLLHLIKTVSKSSRLLPIADLQV